MSSNAVSFNFQVWWIKQENWLYPNSNSQCFSHQLYDLGLITKSLRASFSLLVDANDITQWPGCLGSCQVYRHSVRGPSAIPSPSKQGAYLVLAKQSCTKVKASHCLGPNYTCSVLETRCESRSIICEDQEQAHMGSPH